MRNYLLCSLVLCGLMFMTSCTDSCADIVCENGAVCESGSCQCKDGYSGDDCSIESREDYLGTYFYTQIDLSCANNYNETISESSFFEVKKSNTSVNKIIIEQGNVSFEATLEENKFEGPTFTVSSTNGSVQKTPSGSFFNDKLFMTYQTVEQIAGTQVNCTEEIEAK